MFPPRPSADVYEWLVTAATGRQPEQLQIDHVPSLANGTAAMLRGAATGCGQTLAIKEVFDAIADDRLVARSFDPPLYHDVTLIWTPDNESQAVRSFADHFAAE